MRDLLVPIQQRSLPRLARFHVLVPLTVLLIVVCGSALSFPPGPLCDEGMVLFMEGGCDWGLSNVFFSKLGLLLAVNAVLTVCLVRRVARVGPFVPHLLLLLVLTWQLRSGDRCDTYYDHPNGSLGQMTLEVAAFSVLGMGLLGHLRERGWLAKLLGVLSWNGAHVGVFYLWLPVTPHWTWEHTFRMCGTFLLAALVAFAPALRRSVRMRASSGGQGQLHVEAAHAPRGLPALGWRHVPVIVLLALVLLPTSEVALALIAMWILFRVAHWTCRRMKLGTTGAVVVALLLPGLIVAAALGVRASRWWTIRTYSRALLGQVAEVITEPAAAALRRETRSVKPPCEVPARCGCDHIDSRIEPSSLPEPAGSAVSHLLGDFQPRGGYSFAVLVHLEHGKYLFIQRGSGFGYVDVRRLVGQYSHLTEFEDVERVLLSRLPVETSLGAFVLSTALPYAYFIGTPVVIEPGGVTALVYVSKDEVTSSPSTRSKPFAQPGLFGTRSAEVGCSAAAQSATAERHRRPLPGRRRSDRDEARTARAGGLAGRLFHDVPALRRSATW